MHTHLSSLLNLYLIETPFNTFENRADPDQAGIARAASSGSTLFAHWNMIHVLAKDNGRFVTYLPTYLPSLAQSTQNFGQAAIRVVRNDYNLYFLCIN